MHLRIVITYRHIRGSEINCLKQATGLNVMPHD